MVIDIEPLLLFVRLRERIYENREEVNRNVGYCLASILKLCYEVLIIDVIVITIEDALSHKSIQKACLVSPAIDFVRFDLRDTREYSV